MYAYFFSSYSMILVKMQMILSALLTISSIMHEIISYYDPFSQYETLYNLSISMDSTSIYLTYSNSSFLA